MKTRWNTRPWPVVLVLSMLLLVGCGSSLTPTTDISPLPTPTGQEPAATIALQGPLFSLDEPLTAGQLFASGQGPERMTIAVTDITYVGEVLGRGRIGRDGLFRIELESPLILNHRIGIMLDLEATEIQYTAEMLAELERFRGDGAITIPNVGEAYDAASVKP